MLVLRCRIRKFIDKLAYWVNSILYNRSAALTIDHSSLNELLNLGAGKLLKLLTGFFMGEVSQNRAVEKEEW